MSQNLNYVLAFDGPNCGNWKACMRFFLKSIDVVGLNERIQLTNLQLFKPVRNFPMIKLSVLYVKHFHRLNSQEFQTVNPLKQHGKS